MDFLTMTPDERAKLIARAAQLGLEKTSPKFKVKRFYLDQAANRYTADGSKSHVLGSVFISFWICNWSGTFDAKIVPNHVVDRDADSGLPLRKNQNLTLEVPAADACIEYTSQPGVWIDIAYSDSEKIDVGTIVAELTSTSTVREGETFSQQAITVPATAPFIVIFPATGSRGVGHARNTDATKPMWVGTEAQLNDANYKNICRRIMPNSDELVWKNSAELRARVETGTAVVQVMDQLV